jgi:hypothetical protein
MNFPMSVQEELTSAQSMIRVGHRQGRDSKDFVPGGGLNDVSVHGEFLLPHEWSVIGATLYECWNSRL